MMRLQDVGGKETKRIMLNEMINGFVLKKPFLDAEQAVYVFAANKVNLASNAVSFASFVEEANEDCEVVFLTKELDETDFTRIKKIADKNQCIKLSIFQLNTDMKLPYLDLSVYSMDKDIIYFIPFILKRYKNIVFIKAGTVIKKALVLENNKNNVFVKCFIDDEDVILAVQYYSTDYVNKITLKKICSVLAVGYFVSEKELLEEICRESIGTRYSDCFENGRKNSQYTDAFLKCARDTVFYEKLLYDDINGVKTKKYKTLRYLFPYEAIEKGKKIIIYGAGVVGRQYFDQMQITNYCEVITMVDRNYDEYQHRGRKVEAIEKIKELEYDYIVIANANNRTAEDIKRFLINMGVSQDKIILLKNREWKI